jgi:hypothetical protein
LISRKTRLRRLPVGDNELPSAAESLGRDLSGISRLLMPETRVFGNGGAGAAPGSTLRRDFGVGLH